MFAINKADFSCLCFSFIHALPKGRRPRDAAPRWPSTPAVSTAHGPSTSGLKTSSNRAFLPFPHQRASQPFSNRQSPKCWRVLPVRPRGSAARGCPSQPGRPPLTQSAGRLVGESWRQCELWIRCLWTSSSAEGSVQKWSAVFIFVYSSAQGPTAQRRKSQT